jgi:ribokinase
MVKARGVDLSLVAEDTQHGTGLAVISVDDRAENSIIVISGANMALDQTDADRCIAAMDGAKVLLLQLEVPVEASLIVAKAARARGITVILDPAPARPLTPELYAVVDLITPNEVEAETLVGFRPSDPNTAAQVAAELRKKGVKAAIVKLGAQGAYYASPDAEGMTPAFVVDAIDTVAAGDAFNGGLAAALAEDQPLPEAMRWAAAAGGLATTKKGASTSMPVRSELDQLLKEGKTR